MIRRGNSDRDEGATDDSCRASRRKSIRGAGGVVPSSAVFAACGGPVLFPPYCENVTGSYVPRGPSPGATGTPVMPVAARYRDIETAHEKSIYIRRLRSVSRSLAFGKARFRAAPRLPLRRESIPRPNTTRKGHGRTRAKRDRTRAPTTLVVPGDGAPHPPTRGEERVKFARGTPLYLYI